MSFLDKIAEASKKATSIGKKDSKTKSSKKDKKMEKKRVRKKKDEDGGMDDLMDFSDIDGMIDGDVDDPDEDDDAEKDSVDNKIIDSRISTLEEKMNQMEGSVKSTKSSVSNMNDKLADMDQNILKLLSVYEVVKREINPFIGKNEGGGSDEIDELDPSELGIDGTTLVKTPDAIDDLDDVDFGPDSLIQEETDNEGDIDLEPDLDIGGEEEIPDPEDIQQDVSPPQEETITEEEPSDGPIPENLERTPMSEKMEGADMKEQFREGGYETPREGAMRPQASSGPILNEISYDYRTVILVLRWIEFMFERVTRERISALLDYYKDIGWISDKVKSQIMAYARGEIQNVLSFEPDESDENVLLETSAKQPSDYKKVSDWRLSADDHLKSLLFVTKIANISVNKDTFNSLEEDIKIFTRNLEGYHGV